jgi:hypothetical protein
LLREKLDVVDHRNLDVQPGRNIRIDNLPETKLDGHFALIDIKQRHHDDDNGDQAAENNDT